VTLGKVHGEALVQKTNTGGHDEPPAQSEEEDGDGEGYKRDEFDELLTGGDEATSAPYAAPPIPMRGLLKPPTPLVDQDGLVTALAVQPSSHDALLPTATLLQSDTPPTQTQTQTQTATPTQTAIATPIASSASAQPTDTPLVPAEPVTASALSAPLALAVPVNAATADAVAPRYEL